VKARLTVLLAVTLAIAVAGLIAGCGGGGSSSDGGSEATAEAQTGNSAEERQEEGSAEEAAESEGGEGGSAGKKAFATQAAAACQRERESALQRVGIYKAKHESEGLSESELTEEALKAVVLETVEGELSALRKLEPPAGEEQQFEAILAGLEAELEKAKKKAPKSSAQAVEDSFPKSSRELARLGIPGCAK